MVQEILSHAQVSIDHENEGKMASSLREWFTILSKVPQVKDLLDRQAASEENVPTKVVFDFGGDDYYYAEGIRENSDSLWLIKRPRQNPDNDPDGFTETTLWVSKQAGPEIEFRESFIKGEKLVRVEHSNDILAIVRGAGVFAEIESRLASVVTTKPK